MGEIPPQCQVAAKIDERNRKETYEMTIFTKPFCQIMVAELLTVAAVQIQLPSSNYRLRMLQQHGHSCGFTATRTQMAVQKLKPANGRA